MKTIVLGGLAALVAIGATPVASQPYNAPNSQSSWNRDAFWRGASEDPFARITFLQRRIDRGVTDGSLDRREARRSQAELNMIRRDARRMGRLDSRERDMLLSRLDDLSQRVRWQRQDWNRGNNGVGNSGAGYGGRPYYRDAPDRYVTDYDASRYYRDDPRYTERRLSSDDEVYRGSDGRYYCKRSDGTTGLIVGAAGGAILGNIIDGGRNRAAGTLIGGALGAILGQQVEKNNSEVRCR
ncbi:MAG TPA: glycine zipper 2TM domain-containing protein [Sphingobium sp.]